MLLLILSGAKLWAQYQVEGSTKKPLKVVENTAYKLQVYLVYGMEGVTAYRKPGKCSRTNV